VKHFIEEVGPLLICTGHAHEGRSITRLGSTVIVNAGPAKDGFCAIIEVEDSFVDPQLTTL
jgi:Icc-related predicted phosphoesterase